jgi:GT2 family glycosyltransferase
MASLSDISVIIVNYRGWETLAECLDALLVCGEGRERPEVIVVDNHSGDGQLARFSARYPQVRFLENESNEGFARGNNRGAALAGGHYLLFLNPDTVIPCGALVKLLAESGRREGMYLLALRKVDAAGRPESIALLFPSGWTINALVRLLYRAVRRPERTMRCEGGREVRPDWVSGSLVWMSRETFGQLGGWDEDYWLYYEDVDLCRRLYEAGGEVVMFCEPAVVHRHGGTTRKEKRKVAFFKTYVLISQHIYFRKHFPGLRGSLLLSLLVLNNLLFEQLLPAVAGVLLFPVERVRRHLFIYIYLVKYYLRALSLRRWNLYPEELTFGKKS